jgi:uncharacterized metal-binding protein YceD (DUF177 family)
MMPPKPEFSRIIDVSAIEAGGMATEIEADADERARLASRFGLLGVKKLTADVRLTPEEGGRLVRLAGTLTADVVQTCVVTLEALHNHLEATIERHYATVPSAIADEPVSEEEHLDQDDGDPPDTAIDGRIDVGEAVAEELALSLDPFPRKPGITFQNYAVGEASSETAAEGEKARNSGLVAGPFAALAKLRDKLK